MSDDKVKPLRSRTMTLSQLQLKTLELIRQMKFQLNRASWEDGRSDKEFIEDVLREFEGKILNDRFVLSESRRKKKEASGDE